MRSAEEVKAEQEELARHYNLNWWYYTKGRKCCGVYPKIMKEGDLSHDKVYLECEVCGSRTKSHLIPLKAREEWDEMKPEPEGQMSLFSIF